MFNAMQLTGVNIVDHKSSINHAIKYLFHDYPIKILIG